MKKIIVIVSAAFGIITLLQAKSWQMTYKSHGLIADEINSMKLTKFVDPGMGGYNQVWDFTNLKITKDFKGTVENSVYSKNYNKLFNTNVVLKEFSNQFYFKGNENSLELYGVAVRENLIYKFNKPFVKMKYPFGYGDSFSGTYGGEYLSKNSSGEIDGTYLVEADGYGTLLLPNNLKVENVLRVKTTRSYVNTINKRSYKISIVTYRWYSENERFPLLVLIENGYENSSKATKSYQAAYRSDLSVIAQPTSISNSLTNNSFNLYPNPFASNATINFSVKNTSDVVLDIYNISGEKLMTIIDQQYNTGNYSINISKSSLNIPAGSYYLKIQLGNEFTTQKIIVQ